MIPLVTARQMQDIDRTAIDTMMVPSLDLMEAAGRGVAEAIESHFGALDGKPVLVVCGRGNNGGDGLVAARHLKERGALPHVVVLGAPDALSPDARTNADRWTTGGGTLHHATDDRTLAAAFSAAGRVDLVVDALLGTGSQGAPHGLVAHAIQGLSAVEAPIASIDIPSGIDADTGAVPGSAVEADLTITLALPKRGLYLHPARERVGVLEIADIGIPRAAILEEGAVDFLIETEDVAGLLPRWKADAHKGDRGRLLVVGGSVGLTGAVTLASQAAARAGAGLVTAGIPESLNDILEVKLTEPMTLPLPQGGGRWLGPAAIPVIREFDGGRLSAMVVGPGFSRHEEALEAARGIVTDFACPKVVDADALFAFRGRSGDLAAARVAGPLVLTPHLGEAEWLMGLPAADIAASRIELARQWAGQLGQVVVLKGAPTVIGSPEGESFLNPTGGPALATGGTGDVLAGLIGAFLAQGLSPVHAAIAAVYLHGFTADLLTERRGPTGLVAGDLVVALPEAMGEIVEGSA